MEVYTGGSVMKKLFTILLIGILSVSLFSCKQKDPLADYDLYEYETLKIYVPKDIKLEDMEVEGFDKAWGKEDFIIFTDKVEKKTVEDLDLSDEDFQKLVFGENTKNDLPNCSYTTYTNAGYYYTYGLFEDDTYYYDVNIACNESDTETYKDIMLDILSKIAHS